ncbi:MAG: hypothetical protein ABSH15_12150 [Verrucomicrobiota bacterium]|jgi:hypothetical protein
MNLQAHELRVKPIPRQTVSQIAVASSLLATPEHDAGGWLE